ncbi:MAG: GIY-YIG nuclease family protein [Schleiferiaceae bacterium]|nr:GIY-YIG nuclease family protein [Schleiferiaceae bacterium]
MHYVVVDIETTGGKPNGNDITEIGIVHVQHNKISRSWSSFVKPDRSIPYNIQMLTGITDAMVADAPTFASLAPTLLEELKGDVFVAHSVNFDYSFIERAFKEAGINWRMPKLCTVKYSKAMFPEFGRYSLAHLTQALAVANDNPHRALSDALCAAEVLIHCCIADYNDTKLNDTKLGLLKRIQLPDLMPAPFYDDLPKEAGVYQFLDALGMPLYIGKAKSIKSRITQHFSTDQGSTKYQRLMKECHSISYERFPNETLSLIYEDHLIRQHWPPLNKAQKKQALKFGLYSYENGRGEVKWVVQKAIGSGALRKFGSYVSGQQWLADYLQLARKMEWTQREALSQLIESNGQRLILALPNEQRGALFIERGSITGIYTGDDYLTNEEWARTHFIPVSPSPTINAIGMKLLEQHPDQVILL